jgi:nucleoside-diphosphate-sugar epimerase
MQNELDKSVSIIGCGWLGLPLARYLLAGGGITVKGSTTSPHKLETLHRAGVEAYVASLNPEPQGDDWPKLLDVDLLIVDIPPRSTKQGEEFHPQQIQHLAEMIENSPVSEILYVSSTSVYPELNREVREEDVTRPVQSSAPHLVEAEQLLAGLRETGRQVAVLRCGGLMGYDRIPGKYVRGKKGISTGQVPVNYVHRDDAVAILSFLIRGGVPNETFNCVAPLHPQRRDVYEASCRQFGWEEPTFAEPDPSVPFKVVGVGKLMKFLNHAFLYPDPLHFYYSLHEAPSS